MLTKSGLTLDEAIKRAIDDHVITNAEYEEILRLADADGVIDHHERLLLAELNGMIADGTIKRTAG
ncbi:MAG: hypothetical protein BWY87_00143 [Deltaproteobacteria bacterium ADurb.Bin510]|nr:MAG: hypothetical protein BWY87_00143 [Deltaproteobacteria bacterium ADurb.Bin510]